MSDNKIKTISLQQISDISEKKEFHQRKFKERNSKNARVFTWILEICLGVAPWVITQLGKLICKNDIDVVNRCISLSDSIIWDGSFLWLSITILAIPLFEYFFIRSRNYIKDDDSLYLTVVVISIVLVTIGILLYIINIVRDYEHHIMTVISISSLISYIFFSWILSFGANLITNTVKKINKSLPPLYQHIFVTYFFEC